MERNECKAICYFTLLSVYAYLLPMAKQIMMTLNGNDDASNHFFYTALENLTKFD